MAARLGLSLRHHFGRRTLTPELVHGRPGHRFEGPREVRVSELETGRQFRSYDRLQRLAIEQRLGSRSRPRCGETVANMHRGRC